MGHTNAHVSEKGQALILIVLAVAGLLGLTALAVDGSHVFAQRRQAQNAADTAAFAAALELINGAAPGDGWVQALNRAASNTFTDDTADSAVNSGQNIDVIVVHPPDATAPAAYVGDNRYVQVKINAQIGTFFARVVGVDTLPVHVQAVAMAVPAHQENIGGDNAIVALGEGCDIIKIHGGGHVTLSGGGMWSNSHANGPGTCYAVDLPGGGHVDGPGVDVNIVGCVNPLARPDLDLDPGGHVNCGLDPIPFPPEPDLDLASLCGGPGIITAGTTAGPGIYSPALHNLTPSGSFPKSGVTHLSGGVYCIHGDFNVGAHDTLIGDAGVTFIVYGDTRWNGGATINLIPPDTGDLAHLLIYVPPSGCGIPPCRNVFLAGSGTSQWEGTIFGTDSYCDLEGTQVGVALHAQAICYQVRVGGTVDFSMQYDSSISWLFPFPPMTELNR